MNDKEKYTDPTLKDLIKIIWNSKISLISITAIVSICGVVYALSLPNIYKSSAVLAPVTSQQGSQSAMRAFGSLSSIAGINLPSPDASPSDEGLEIMESFSFFEELAKNENLIPNLMAVSYWNFERNEIIYDSDIYIIDEKKWVRDYIPPRKQIPSNQEAFEIFKDSFSVEVDDESSFVTISFSHESPYFARDVLDLIILNINNLIREKEKQKAEISIDFLNNQLAKTNLTEVKQVISSLIQNEVQTIMLAEASPDFVFKVLDKPVVSELKDGPRRSVIAIISTFLGFFIGIFSILFRYILIRLK